MIIQPDSCAEVTLINFVRFTFKLVFTKSLSSNAHCVRKEKHFDILEQISVQAAQPDKRNIVIRKEVSPI